MGFLLRIMAWENNLSILHRTDAKPDRIIYDDVLREVADIADPQHYFSETAVRSVDDSHATAHLYSGA